MVKNLSKLLFNEKRKMWKFCLPVLIAVLMGTLFINFSQHPIGSDAAGYYSTGSNISENGLTNFFKYVKSTREPGYIFFLGICFKLVGPNDTSIRGMQVLLFAATALILYLLAKEYYGERIALIASLLFSFCPTFANYTTFFLTETLAVFLFVLSCFLICKALQTDNMPTVIGASIVLILATFTKYIFVFFGLFFMLLVGRRNILKWNTPTKLVFKFILVVIVPILCLAVWFQISVKGNDGRLGYMLISNSAEIALPTNEKIARFIGLFSRNLGEKVFPETDYKKLWPYPEVREDLIEEANKRFGHLLLAKDRNLKMTIELYKENPLGFIYNRVTTLMRLNAFQYLSRLNETDRWVDFYNRKDNKNYLIILGDIILKFFSNPFVWGLSGMMIMKKKGTVIYPIVIPIIYINIIYCFLDGIPRYGLPSLPFHFIGGAFLIDYILKKPIHRTSNPTLNATKST